MDARLENINKAVEEINHNLFLLMGGNDPQVSLAIEDCFTAINEFQKSEMHDLRKAMEGM